MENQTIRRPDWEMIHRLVGEWGTPLYVYDLDELAASVRTLQASLPSPHTLLYSVKANPSRLVLEMLSSLGVGAEVSSAGELRRALASGFCADAILLTGPGKSERTLEAAAEAGCRWISVESIAEWEAAVRCLSRHGSDARVLARVNLPQKGRGARLRMNTGSSKFGIDIDTFGPRRTGTARRHLDGVHFFDGSNVADGGLLADLFDSGISAAAELQRSLGAIGVVDLGGGFPAPFAVDEPVPPLTFGEEIATSLDRHLSGWRNGEPEILFESGRRIVASCGSLVCRVTDIKRSGGQTFVLVDSGIHHLGGLRGAGRLLPARIDMMRRQPGSGERAEAVVAGPLCTPLDSWGRVRDLEGVASGETLVVPNVGAYGLTASMVGFLSHDLPIELGLRGGKVVSAVQAQVTETELTRDSTLARTDKGE